MKSTEVVKLSTAQQIRLAQLLRIEGLDEIAALTVLSMEDNEKK